MKLEFNFVVDRIIKDKAYPALARWSAEPYTQQWREFVNHWPYTVPCELIEHCEEFDMPYNLYLADQEFPESSYYPIGLGFFDFGIDYFGLIPEKIFDSVECGQLKILFYYHEGDNPYIIKERLDNLCLAWHLPRDCYRFISGNTAAEKIPGFVYFADHELLYWRRNKSVPATPVNYAKRSRDFTCLSRTHKWWRATAVADLCRSGLLSNSLWSYNTEITINDLWEDNPIEIDTLEIRPYLTEFITAGPYRCDQSTADQHNDHSRVDTELFSSSYVNIILETHFDADQSGGTFLTEKTFKVLKHGQPFIVVGPAGTLATLRKLGYRTYDHCIDNSYDSVRDNTQRWQRIQQEISRLHQRDLAQWITECYPEAEHNQQLFCQTKRDRLNMLLERLHHD